MSNEHQFPEFRLHASGNLRQEINSDAQKFTNKPLVKTVYMPAIIP